MNRARFSSRRISPWRGRGRRPLDPVFSSESGLALITVVALLAVMSIMAIAFTLAVRNEEQAVRNYVHFASVQDVSNAGAGVARSQGRDAYLGPDGKPHSGDERVLVDSLEDQWAGGFADVLSRAEGLRMVYNARSRLFSVDRDSTFTPTDIRLLSANLYAGLNRPLMLGVDEDPAGDRDGLSDEFGRPQPGLPGVDDDGDGGVDLEDPEVRAAIASDPDYIPYYDDDEDGVMDEDGPDIDFNEGFGVGLGFDIDGDRVGVFDECSKLHLNYTGNRTLGIIGSDFVYMYGDGVSTFEIYPAMMFFDRLDLRDAGLVISPIGAARLATQIVDYVYGAYVSEAVPAPGIPGVEVTSVAGDDNFNSYHHAKVLIVVGNEESPHMGNEGDHQDTNFDGVVDDVREYPINIDGIDNDGDGQTDELGEGIDEPSEFTTKPPDLIHGIGRSQITDDRPYETPEAAKLAAADEALSLRTEIRILLDIDCSDGSCNTHVPSTLPPELRDELRERTMTTFDLVKDYLTVYSTAPQEIVGKGYARERINPNLTSNLIPLVSRRGVESFFPLMLDNDGDWQAQDEINLSDGIDNDGDGLTDERSDDHNQNGIADADWDGAAEIGLYKPDGSDGGPAVDGVDNDRDGLTDNYPLDEPGYVYDESALYDDGDINRDGISWYDPEWHVDEDPWGDANGDGKPGIGFDNPLLRQLFDDEEMRELADDDGDGGWDLGEAFGSSEPVEANADPEVWRAWREPYNDGVDNNWNSPVWLYDGIDNDNDGLIDERASEDPDGKDEGVDEPGEWYIPAFDDDEDGRMDEDPPEFQFLLNLADAVDRPIPTYDDMLLEPKDRLGVPQAPDPPQPVRTVPRYSLFHVRDPLRSVDAGGNRERLEEMRNELANNVTLAEVYAAKPQVAYRGGEAIRINEVMAVPFIRVWHDDEQLIPQDPVVGDGQDADDVCTFPCTDPYLDASSPHFDDVWHLFHEERATGPEHPLEGELWIVHNDGRLLLPDGVNPRDPLPNEETLTIDIERIPEGLYQARYITFPPEHKSGSILIGGHPVNGFDLENEDGYPPVVIEVLDPAVAGTVRSSTDIPEGEIPRVVTLDDISVGSGDGGRIRIRVTVDARTTGTFGFTALELYDPDQQYVELINLTKGVRPVVLNGSPTGAGDINSKAWSIRVERPESSGFKEFMLQGAIYSNDTPFNRESRGENISLVTRTGNTRRPLDEVRSTLVNNYHLDDFWDDRDSDDETPEPMDLDAERFQNLFLTSVLPAGATEPDLDIFRGEDLFSRDEGGDLILGGRAEARILLTALEDPDDDISPRFTIDQVRVAADTKGRQYRGYQGSERDDPFSGVYEPRTLNTAEGVQRRLSRVRQFTRLYARDALAVRDIDTMDPLTVVDMEDDWPRPGAPWSFEASPTDISAGFFRPPDDNEVYHGVWRWLIDERFDPWTQWVSVRVFGNQTVTNDRYEQPAPAEGRIGWATVSLSTGEYVAEDLYNGDVLIPYLDLDLLPVDLYGRRVLEIEFANARWKSDYSGIEPIDTSFSYLEFSTAGTMARFDTDEVDETIPDDLPLLGGTAGRVNGTYLWSPDAPEHWDGMMPNTARVAFISSGMPNRPLTLDEAAQVVPQLTTHLERNVPGLININTAQRPVLLCLPWAQPPHNRMMDDTAFRRMYDFAKLMTMAVTNARQEMGPWRQGTETGKDDDRDGFTDEGPYQTTGEIIRAIHALRWVYGLSRPTGVDIDWPDYGYGQLADLILMQEFRELAGDQTLMPGDVDAKWLTRLEKEIFARVSNLITVRSNVFEIGTRGRVVTDDGQVLAESFTVQVFDRRY